MDIKSLMNDNAPPPTPTTRPDPTDPRRQRREDVHDRRELSTSSGPFYDTPPLPQSGTFARLATPSAYSPLPAKPSLNEHRSIGSGSYPQMQHHTPTRTFSSSYESPVQHRRPSQSLLNGHSSGQRPSGSPHSFTTPPLPHVPASYQQPYRSDQTPGRQPVQSSVAKQRRTSDVQYCGGQAPYSPKSSVLALPPPPPQRSLANSAHGTNYSYAYHRRSVSGHLAQQSAQQSPASSSVTLEQLGTPQNVQDAMRRVTEVSQDDGRSTSVSPKTRVLSRPVSQDQRTPAQVPRSGQRPSSSSYRSTPHSQPLTTTNLVHVQGRVAESSPAHIFQGNARESRQSYPSPIIKSESLLQQPLSHVQSSPPMKDSPTVVRPDRRDESIPRAMSERSPAQPSQKRPVDDSADLALSRKKPRRKYDHVPIWARLAPSNPRYDEQIHGEHAFATIRPQQQPPPPPQQAVQQTVDANGHSVAQQDRQLLDQKVRTADLLGAPWEMSITDVVPADEFVNEVATFLYLGMLRHPELGTGDARLGNLEIEAKLGRLERHGEGGRIRLPVSSMTILEPGMASELQFVSNMNNNQHKAMNFYLNERTKDSMSPNRVPLTYKHRRELDSFRSLSPAGMKALPYFPESEINPHHKLKLRTTTDMDPKIRAMHPRPPVIARIVKRRLHDLSIYSPKTDYDLRISINIEVDIQGRDDIDPDMIVAPEERNAQPDRFKDRLSYGHCAYSIDLTQVTCTDHDGRQEQTHELEVEIDAASLRRQALALKDGRPNAYEALVQGLLNNCFLLMRVKGGDNVTRPSSEGGR